MPSRPVLEGIPTNRCDLPSKPRDRLFTGFIPVKRTLHHPPRYVNPPPRISGAFLPIFEPQTSAKRSANPPFYKRQTSGPDSASTLPRPDTTRAQGARNNAYQRFDAKPVAEWLL